MAIGSTVKQYPTEIDVFTIWQDDIDNIIATIVNDCESQIVAIETELGTNPSGTAENVKNRLAVSINDDGTLKAGTIQRKSVVINTVNGQYNFNFTNEGLSDYSTTNYQVFLTVQQSGSASLGAWTAYSDKTISGFIIKTYIPGTNGPAIYDASLDNMSITIDVLTIG